VCRRLDGLRGRSGECGKSRPPTGIRTPDEIDVGEDIIEYNIRYSLMMASTEGPKHVGVID